MPMLHGHCDSISTITESTSRVLTAVRTVSESIPTLTEAVTRVMTYARTVSESVSSLSLLAVASGVLTATP